MIKYFKYIFAVAIVMMAAVACQDDVEDSFSTNPAAPVLTNNGSILLTENTMSESIVWAWKAARFLPGTVNYSLYAEYENSQKIQIGSSTTALSLTMTKPNFQEALKGITSLPENSSFNLTFTVVASDGFESVTSEKQVMTVYSYGNAVSAVATAEVTEVVLDMNDPEGTLELITWEAARLIYGETITYNVYMSYNDGALYEVASGLSTLSLTKTVDEWNEAAIAAGAPEAVASDIQFTVTAFCEGYPEGVPSTPVTINMTTYVATFATEMYLPGNYQGWNPATSITIPHSTLTKGYYEAYVDLTTEDGGNVEFKFCPDPTWDNAFGGSNIVVATDGDGNVVVTGLLITGDGATNISAPSGMYRIAMNKKLNKFEMIKIESMGVIGSATPGGWGEETPMVYDAATRTYSLTTTMIEGEFYKFRANNNWTYSIGDNGAFEGGDNYAFNKATGEYKIVLDVTKHPYEVKLFSTSFPEQLYLPGSHQGWNPAAAPTLKGNGEGIFEGGVLLTDASGADVCEFKFSPNPSWTGDFGGTVTWDGDIATGEYGVSSNIPVSSGYYYIVVNMNEGSLQLTRINKVGLIGSFNSWGGDAEFVYDATSNLWTLTTALSAGDEVKVRMNADWYMNRGFAGAPTMGVATPVYNDGPNINIAADATYTITLDMSSNPNTIKFTN